MRGSGSYYPLSFMDSGPGKSSLLSPFIGVYADVLVLFFFWMFVAVRSTKPPSKPRRSSGLQSREATSVRSGRENLYGTTVRWLRSQKLRSVIGLIPIPPLPFAFVVHVADLAEAYLSKLAATFSTDTNKALNFFFPHRQSSSMPTCRRIYKPSPSTTSLSTSSQR